MKSAIRIIVAVFILAVFAGAVRADDCRVNLNSATSEQIQLLVRTGPKMAEKIIAARPLDAVKLDAVKGIGPSWLANNEPHVAYQGATTCTTKLHAAPKATK